MPTLKNLIILGAAAATAAILPAYESFAQAPAPAAQSPAAGAPVAGRGGRGARGPAETWTVPKTKGGVYNAPMRPIWKKADLLAMHKGQNNWQEQIIKDPEQDATYNSGAPGTQYVARIHPDTPTVFVVIQGEVTFNVEGQQPAVAKRGAIINIMKTTVFSYSVTGSENALWVEVNPTNYKTAYPTSVTAPPPPAGAQNVVISFAHRPAPYDRGNRLMFNTFDDAINGCKGGAVVDDDHIWASPLLGYVNAADNKCNPGATGNIGSGPLKPDAPKFNPQSTFGHMHPGPAEWWIVQVGQIRGQFENMGEYHATEGDVLYAAPMGWHQMAAEAPNGPNVRLAFGGYQLINMNNTTAAGGRGGRGE
jgi:mannose-6-phosphate isomerase-like protein (cupin superfamily)